MGASLGQWMSLLGIGLLIAGIYYAAKWAENLEKRLLRDKGKKKSREERRQKLRDRLEDRLWLAREKKKIKEELEKENGN